MAAFQSKGNIYYRTITTICPGSELLVLYDENYAMDLFADEVCESSVIVKEELEDEQEEQVKDKQDFFEDTLEQSEYCIKNAMDKSSLGHHPVHAGGVINGWGTSRNNKDDIQVKTINGQDTGILCNSSQEGCYLLCRLNGTVMDGTGALQGLEGTVQDKHVRCKAVTAAKKGKKGRHKRYGKPLASGGRASNIDLRRSSRGNASTRSKDSVSAMEDISLNFRKKQLECRSCRVKFLTESHLLKHKCKATSNENQDISSVSPDVTANSTISPDVTTAEVGKSSEGDSSHEGLQGPNNFSPATKLHKCPLCEKSFSRKYNMSQHCKTHYQEKSFECEYCHKLFHYKRYLQWHLLTHTKERPLKCDHCSKRFCSQGMLAKHVGTHTEEKNLLFKCDYCGTQFKTKNRMQVHTKMHLGGEMHKCSRCFRSFATQSKLASHVKVHVEEKPYKCEHCSMAFRAVSNLLNHIRTHTRERPYKCSWCDKTYSHPSNFYLHRKSHYRDKSKQHGQESSLDGGFATHSESHAEARFNDGTITKLHERVGININEDFEPSIGEDLLEHSGSREQLCVQQCLQECFSKSASEGEQVCGAMSPEDSYKTRCEDDAGTHSCNMEASSNLGLSVNTLQCPYCREQFHSLVDLLEHRRTCVYETREGGIESAEVKIIRVENDISGEARNANDASRELEICANIGKEDCSNSDPSESPLECRDFQEQVCSKTDLLGHNCKCLMEESQKSNGKLNTVSRTRKKTSGGSKSKEESQSHVCRECGQNCVSLKALQNHRASHRNKYQYACPICQKIFSRKYNMIGHWKAHSHQERPFKCEQCLKSFRFKRYLKWHMVTHSEEKPFKCDLCSKSFKKSYHLKVHIMEHKGEKPHKCGLCDKGFATVGKLNAHHKTHQIFKCDHCNERFATADILDAHHKTHREEEPFKCHHCDDERFATAETHQEEELFW